MTHTAVVTRFALLTLVHAVAATPPASALTPTTTQNDGCVVPLAALVPATQTFSSGAGLLSTAPFTGGAATAAHGKTPTITALRTHRTRTAVENRCLELQISVGLAWMVFQAADDLLQAAWTQFWLCYDGAIELGVSNEEALALCSEFSDQVTENYDLWLGSLLILQLLEWQLAECQARNPESWWPAGGYDWIL